MSFLGQPGVNTGSACTAPRHDTGDRRGVGGLFKLQRRVAAHPGLTTLPLPQLHLSTFEITSKSYREHNGNGAYSKAELRKRRVKEWGEVVHNGAYT